MRIPLFASAPALAPGSLGRRSETSIIGSALPLRTDIAAKPVRCNKPIARRSLAASASTRSAAGDAGGDGLPVVGCDPLDPRDCRRHGLGPDTIARTVGVHEVHYAIIIILAMGIGLFAPPFGVGYYAACAIGRVDPAEGIRPIWGYLLALLVGLIIVAIFPWISIGFL